MMFMNYNKYNKGISFQTCLQTDYNLHLNSLFLKNEINKMILTFTCKIKVSRMIKIPFKEKGKRLTLPDTKTNWKTVVIDGVMWI